jgi:hypothetical protein
MASGYAHVVPRVNFPAILYIPEAYVGTAACDCPKTRTAPFRSWDAAQRKRTSRRRRGQAISARPLELQIERCIHYTLQIPDRNAGWLSVKRFPSIGDAARCCFRDAMSTGKQARGISSYDAIRFRRCGSSTDLTIDSLTRRRRRAPFVSPRRSARCYPRGSPRLLAQWSAPIW